MYLKPDLSFAPRDDGTIQIGSQPPLSIILDPNQLIGPAAAGEVERSVSEKQSLILNFLTQAAAGRRLRELRCGLAPAQRRELTKILTLAQMTTNSAHRTGPERAWQRLDDSFLNVWDGVGVEFRGLSSLGAAIAMLAVKSGLRQLKLRDDKPVTSGDIGEYSGAEVGVERAAAIAARITAFTGREFSNALKTDVSVLTRPFAIPYETVVGYARAERPYLVVTWNEAEIQVGPFVRPGVSACPHCLNLARTEVDPAYPYLLAKQLTTPAPALEPVVINRAAACAIQVLRQFAMGGATDADNMCWLFNPVDACTRYLRLFPRRDCGCRLGA